MGLFDDYFSVSAQIEAMTRKPGTQGWVPQTSPSSQNGNSIDLMCIPNWDITIIEPPVRGHLQNSLLNAPHDPPGGPVHQQHDNLRRMGFKPEDPELIEAYANAYPYKAPTSTDHHARKAEREVLGTTDQLYNPTGVASASSSSFAMPGFQSSLPSAPTYQRTSQQIDNRQPNSRRTNGQNRQSRADLPPVPVFHDQPNTNATASQYDGSSFDAGSYPPHHQWQSRL